MKKTTLSLIIAIIILAQTAFSEDWMKSNELELKTTISSDFELISTSSNYNIDYALVYLYFFPKDNFQTTVLTKETEPKATINQEDIFYRWENPKKGAYSFKLSSTIKNQNKIQRIKQKIQFPLKNIPSEYLIYAKPSETIDSDRYEIIKQASEIVEGTDDLFEAVFKLASWTENNVEYSLNTITADITQKASWVLESKYGVCDELTALFIAMARSLGIPARFVSGVAYTNYNNINDWGPHAWAEVYFPDVGWVPFDLTYGQFGYVDLSHIVLKYSVDANEPSNKYEWRGRDIKLKSEPIDIKVNFEKYSGKLPENIEFKTNLLLNSIGFNSYNLVELEIENIKDYYLAYQFKIAAPYEVDIIGDDSQQIILKPDEKKKIYWKIKLNQELDPNFIYTFPIAVYTTNNVSSKTSFISSSKDTVYSSEYIDEVIKSYTKEEKTYSTEISLECSSNKQVITTSESAEINCKIKNQGNMYLKDLNICLYKKCKKVDLGISQEKEILLIYSSEEPGKRSLLIKAYNKQASKSDSIIMEVLDTPKLSITEISVPEKIEFKDKYTMELVLDKESYADPLDIEIKLIQNKKIDLIKIKNLERDQKLRVHLAAKNLKKGVNNIKITANYKDKEGNEYSTQTEAQIKLINVSPIQQIQILFYSLANYIEGLFI